MNISTKVFLYFGVALCVSTDMAVAMSHLSQQTWRGEPATRGRGRGTHQRQVPRTDSGDFPSLKAALAEKPGQVLMASATDAPTAGAPAAAMQPLPPSPHIPDVLEVLQTRNLLTEKATNLGYSQLLDASSPETTQELAETILGRTFADNNEQRSEASAKIPFTLTDPAFLHIAPHTDGSEGLDSFNCHVVKGALIFEATAQQENDDVFIRDGLKRILEAQKEELSLAEGIKKSTEEVSESQKRELATKQQRVLLEKKRLEFALFHLSMVRGYIVHASSEAQTLESKDDITAGDRARALQLRESSRYLYEIMHALYDYERSRIAGITERLWAHGESKTRYEEVFHEIANHARFSIDAAYLHEKPDFVKLLEKLFYQQKAPQLVEALTKGRIRFGDSARGGEASAAGAGAGPGAPDSAPSGSYPSNWSSWLWGGSATADIAGTK